MQVSIVLPVFNESPTLVELHRRLSEVLRSLVNCYELVYVDDGSSDESYKVLEDLFAADPLHVRLVRLSRNFGHHIAITAGLDASLGDYVVMMDSDLQDLPEEIPKLYHKIREGYDCVYAIRMEKQHSLFKRLTSQIFNSTMNGLVQGEIRLTGAIFRIMNRPFVDSFLQLRESNRSLVGLMSWMGFRQIGVEVRHGARFAGETKYSLSKMVRLAFDSMTALTFRPLQLATYLGLTTSSLAAAGIAYLFFARLVLQRGVEGWTSIMVAILFMGGVQLFCLGLVGEYVGRTYLEGKKRPLYVVASEIGGPFAESEAS